MSRPIANVIPPMNGDKVGSVEHVSAELVGDVSNVLGPHRASNHFAHHRLVANRERFGIEIILVLEVGANVGTRVELVCVDHHVFEVEGAIRHDEEGAPVFLVAGIDFVQAFDRGR